jgi:pyruvate/2-oxoglutarate dehydrogenase complex dihydrolipoamide acyltransferase (E2) component
MPEPIKIFVPRESVNDTESTIVDWKIESGKALKEGEILVEMENSKTSFDIIAPQDGFYYFIHAKGTRIPVGATCAILSSEELNDQSWKEVFTSTTKSKLQGKGKKFSAKAYQKIIELNLNEDDFQSERLLKLEDVLAYVEKQKQHDALSDEVGKVTIHIPSLEKLREIDYLSQTISHHLLSSVTISIDIKKAQQKEEFIKKTIKGAQLGEIISYEAVRCLKAFPNLNSQFLNQKIYRYSQCHVGIALNLGKGLRVPVIQCADELNLKDFILKNKDLYLKYLKNEFSSNDFNQGTFTITNLFSLCVRNFSPIPLPNQTAILGICGPSEGYQDFLITMSFDHRVSDGMEVAKFLNHLRSTIYDISSE